jgi:hypothetical protein
MQSRFARRERELAGFIGFAKGVILTRSSNIVLGTGDRAPSKASPFPSGLLPRVASDQSGAALDSALA